jgi:hypothetical protein
VADLALAQLSPRRSGITREQSRKIDRLYMQIEKKDPGLIPPTSRRKTN